MRLAAVIALVVAGCSAPPADPGADGGAPPDLALPALATRAPLGKPPADPLAGKGGESCAGYREEQGQGGGARPREIYAPAGGSFGARPAPLLVRAFLFDRWYDLYQQPDGQTAERRFDGPVPAGTPESA